MSDEPIIERHEDEPEPAPAAAPVDPNAGKTVIVAGSPEHEALLKSYPNATSYGPDVVIVQPPEPAPVEPEAEDEVVDEDEAERRRANEPDEDRVED